MKLIKKVVTSVILFIAAFIGIIILRLYSVNAIDRNINEVSWITGFILVLGNVVGGVIIVVLFVSAILLLVKSIFDITTAITNNLYRKRMK